MRFDHPCTVMRRLARDTRGNTIAIMAAMLIPMTALAGSAIDAARLYVVKVRLQQACDAGVLAGRKFMTGTGATLDATATTRARDFFVNNFALGWMATSATVFTPVKTSDSQVSGTAVTTVPMTLMKIFGIADSTLNVTCQARYDVADTDILFVLDTTGSMACLPSDSDSTCTSYAGSASKNSFSRPSNSGGVSGYAGATGYGVQEKSGSRIAAVRNAVLSFYDTFASAADPSTRVRYGFVTYSSSVNAGKAVMDVIPSALIGTTSGDTANYQSRRVTDDYTISTSDSQNSKTSSQCSSFTTTRTPATALTYDSSNGQATRTSNVYYNNRCYTRTETLGPTWTYKQYAFDVSGVVGGATPVNPTKVRGQTMRWLGCMETPVTTPGQTTFSATSPPSEIDPDVRPTGAARWFPHLQDLEYVRNGSFTNAATDTTNGDDWSVAPGYGSDAYAYTPPDRNGNARSADGDSFQKSGAVACGKPVKRLGTMTRSEVSAFVNAADFVPMGGTYHDTGMIWGGRLISPTGPWAADTAAASGRNAPNRVIVFLTDGDMAPTTSSYSMYGLEGYDRRVTNGDFSNIINYHNQRFLAACAAAKAHNIDIWTVQIDTSASNEMQTCATTTTQALFTTDGTDLGNLFATIAKKLAMLRLSA